MYESLGIMNSVCTLSVLAHFALSLQAQAATMGLVVKLVVCMHDAAQVNTAHFLCCAFALQVLKQAVNDQADASFIFQIVHIL